MGVPGAWAQALLLLLLLVAVATEAQNSVCAIEQLIYNVTENDSKALNQPLANITTGTRIDVVLTSESMNYFKIQAQDQGQGQDLFLKVVPDFEVQPILLANMECRSGNAVVGKLTFTLEVLDVNDNAPEFPNTIYTRTVSEDTRVGAIVIPASELQATDKDLNDVLYYTLEAVTLNADKYFSLLSRTQPGLKLQQRLRYDQLPSMTFKLVVHDTKDGSQVPRHSAEASVVVEVLPADLRPPWFLPCVYNDSNTCIQAQYEAILPINVSLPYLLKMSPGPIYAVDGDWAINEKIFYDLINEGENSVFHIDRETGNLTMEKSVDNPEIFQLLVKGTQESGTRYSVTQVTVNVTSDKSHISFPLSLYRGFVVLGQGANVSVKDSADPSQPLTLRARDITYPHNSNFQYQIMDDRFHMDGEAVLTTDKLVDPGVYTTTVEATNMATQSSGSTKVEIRVLSPPTPPPGTNTNPTSSSGTSQAMTSGTPGTGTTTTTGTVTVTDTGTVTSTVTTPGTLTTSRTVTVPGAVTTSGASGTVTAAPEKVTTSGIVTAAPGSVTTTTSGTVTGTVTAPGTVTGTGTVPGGSEDGGDSGTHPESESLRFSAVHMAVLGGVLGALLLVTLLALSVLVHKHYGHRIRCCCSRNSLKSQPEGYDNKTFAVDSEDNWAPAPSPAPSPARVKKAPAPPTPPSTATPSPPASPATPVAPATPEGGSPAAVRSILTKERRPEGGYKAVWFGEDIGAEADVVVLNSPTVDAQAGSDSERDSDRDSDHQGDSGSEDGAHGDATYI